MDSQKLGEVNSTNPQGAELVAQVLRDSTGTSRIWRY